MNQKKKNLTVIYYGNRARTKKRRPKQGLSVKSHLGTAHYPELTFRRFSDIEAWAESTYNESKRYSITYRGPGLK